MWRVLRRAAWIAAAIPVLSVLGQAQRTQPGGTGPADAGTIEHVPQRIDFGALRSDQIGAVRTWRITNRSDTYLFLTNVVITGSDAAAFRVLQAPRSNGPFGIRPGIPPGKTRGLSVVFEPRRLGLHRAELRIDAARTGPFGSGRIVLRGVGLGPLGDELRVNAGGVELVDDGGRTWAGDYGMLEGRRRVPSGAITGGIAGPNDEELYRSQRAGTVVRYSFQLPAPGAYTVTLHFVELEQTTDGARVFDVYADGEPVLLDLDLHAVAGAGVAHTQTFTGRAQDDVLDLDLVASVGQATVSAIEISSRPMLESVPDNVALGAVPQGGEAQALVDLVNSGSQGTVIDSLALRFGASGTAESFTVELDGNAYAGASTDVLYDVDIPLAPATSLPLLVTFRPLLEQYDVVSLELVHTHGTLELELSGLGGHEGDPYLHVVIEGEAITIDRDSDGQAAVHLDGTSSHTHEPGRSLADYRWTMDGTPAGSGPVLDTNLALGPHVAALEIEDDNLPPRTLSLSQPLNVLGVDEVPGVLVRYYPSAPGQAAGLLDSVPGLAEFGEVLPAYVVTGPASVGGSPYAADVLVVLEGELRLSRATTLDLVATGGADLRLFLNGTPVTGPRSLTQGRHRIEARFAVNGLSDLPLEVWTRLGNSNLVPLPESSITHDESGLAPVISSMQDRGTTLGGNPIVIAGLGYFPSGDVTVHWGAQDLTASDFTQVSADLIQFSSPPGSAGDISVTVETSRGVSNARTFTYDDSGPVPILFATGPTLTIPQPTAGAWGPDGNLYVTSLDGRLHVIEFADDWSMVSMTEYPGVSLLENHDTLGIAFDPYESDGGGPIRVYLSHGHHFLNGGSSFSGPSDYAGQVSVLTGPSFDAPVPLITGLPSSNHDHGMNAILFDHNGDLLLSVGGNTNAGVRHPSSGDLPESPLSGAIVLAETSKPGFNGAVTYLETVGGAQNLDQVYGEEVDVATGVDLTPYATGLRNAYDFLLATNGRLYATDNGPNIGFGAASTGSTTQSSEPQEPDEVILVEHSGYYGHPNRCRGRYDARENVFYGTAGPSVPGVFTQALATIPSSTNGIVEYRADTFADEMRGDLIAQKWSSYMRRIELSDDGRQALSVTTIFPWTGALDLMAGPGGALLGLDYSSSRLRVLVPNDQAAIGLVVYDIHPWRAPATGGTEFVLGGVGFGNPGNTSVTIGGRSATLTSVSANRIRGWVPANPTPDAGLLDVVVTSAGQTDTHQRAFRYLLGRGLEPGRWETLDDLTDPLGEVSAGVIDGVLYLVGEGSSATYAYDLATRTWLPNRASRPYPGHHHGGEVVGGRWYLIGGLGGGAEGRVQIYEPATDTWTTGADMSWAGGSVSTGVVNGLIHAAGGIVSTWTVNNCARYDPATDTWTAQTPMPAGRNHAASASDGARLYVFGGRTGGNWVANGFDDVQVFDPVTNSWDHSADPLSTLAPLPQARGGMGSAVLYRGELYVFGGETANGGGAVAGNVYDRVDVYDPESNTWRLETRMPVPRHGIDPVRYQNAIYLPGGGTNAGFSQSLAFDVFSRL